MWLWRTRHSRVMTSLSLHYHLDQSFVCFHLTIKHSRGVRLRMKFPLKCLYTPPQNLKPWRKTLPLLPHTLPVLFHRGAPHMTLPTWCSTSLAPLSQHPSYLSTSMTTGQKTVWWEVLSPPLCTHQLSEGYTAQQTGTRKKHQERHRNGRSERVGFFFFFLFPCLISALIVTILFVQ